MKYRKDVTRLIELIASEFDDVDPADINPESRFKELIEWNSINSVVLSIAIEEAFGVLLEKDDYDAAISIEQLLESIIQKKEGAC